QLNNLSFFDVETPSPHNDSICQIAVISENLNDYIAWESLIDPQDDFHPRNVSIHGISADQIIGQPTFPDIWPQIEHYFKNHIVVGHNVNFDLSVLYKNIFHYKL